MDDPQAHATATEAPPGDDLRQDPVRCPHCDEITMPNRLADGSTLCSCTAGRPLSLAAAGDGRAAVPPVDAEGLASADPAHRLPPDQGQFGRDVATEDFARLRDPPARGEAKEEVKRV